MEAAQRAAEQAERLLKEAEAAAVVDEMQSVVLLEREKKAELSMKNMLALELGHEHAHSVEVTHHHFEGHETGPISELLCFSESVR